MTNWLVTFRDRDVAPEVISSNFWTAEENAIVFHNGALALNGTYNQTIAYYPISNILSFRKAA